MLCKKLPQFRTGYINTPVTILSTGNWPIAKPTLEIIKKVALKIGYYESGPPRLRCIGLIAIGRVFKADVALGKLEFYKSALPATD